LSIVKRLSGYWRNKSTIIIWICKIFSEKIGNKINLVMIRRYGKGKIQSAILWEKIVVQLVRWKRSLLSWH